MLTEMVSPALAVLAYMTILFVIAQLLKDNSIVDIGWGAGFVLVALLTLFGTGDWFPRPLIVPLLVLLWGLRLSVYIFLRNRGSGEDFRYVKWRREWRGWFLIRSFFQIFMLQGFIMLVVSSSIIAIITRSGSDLGPLDLIGIFAWLIGFFFEAVGDRQLRRFKRDPANAGRVMDRGLWRYTRHPNYFGESVMWWGIFLLAVGLPGGWITVISPFTITLLLLRVSGIAMLEKALIERRSGYREYVERTSPFIPLPPRGVNPDEAHRPIQEKNTAVKIAYLNGSRFRYADPAGAYADVQELAELYGIHDNTREIKDGDPECTVDISPVIGPHAGIAGVAVSLLSGGKR